MHGDICGCMPTSSIKWEKYFLTFVDDYLYFYGSTPLNQEWGVWKILGF